MTWLRFALTDDSSLVTISCSTVIIIIIIIYIINTTTHITWSMTSRRHRNYDNGK